MSSAQPTQHVEPFPAEEMRELQADTQERKQRWGIYFRNLTREWQFADSTGERIIISPKDIANEIGTTEVTVRKWLKGQAFPSRDNSVRVAQWARRPVAEVCLAAGWNPKEDGGYQTVSILLDAVRASNIPEAYKRDMLEKLEITISPDFVNDPQMNDWMELIRHALNQRIGAFAKAERVASLVTIALKEREQQDSQRNTASPSAQAERDV